jgi:hypothetical protein
VSKCVGTTVVTGPVRTVLNIRGCTDLKVQYEIGSKKCETYGGN